ncbi:MAG: proline--tRNA ligase [Candidatus ainarchaeum sp.]|nr:proline--tRNA ligase [Candidatus ainarchaeum sp.]
MNMDKSGNFSEWYNGIIKEAELCDLRYNIKGFIVIMPWAMRSINLIYDVYERELQECGHFPAFFPSLVPEKSFLAEKEHVEGFTPEVMWVTEAGGKKLEERYALKPTGETSIYPMYALWVNGLSDLPVKIYQRGWVWRYETKATKPFVRGREFLWIEAHDVFASSGQAKEQVAEDISIAKEVVWRQLGIPFIFFRRPQWDKFAGADDTFAADTLMPDGKVLQIATTHLLGQHFSKAYGIRYMDEKNEMKHAWQTCYGPGISRIYAASVAVHGDSKGMVLPFCIAPAQVVVIPIMRKGNEEKIFDAAKALKQRLAGKMRVELDARDLTPGFKFNHWELRGVPIRIELGERDLASESAVLVTRDDGKKRSVKLSELEGEVAREGAKLDARLKDKSSKLFKSALDSAKSEEEMAEKVNAGKIVEVPFCSEQKDGEGCAKAIKEKYSIDVRGTVCSFFDSEEVALEAKSPKGEKCVHCRKPAKVMMYVSRQY